MRAALVVLFLAGAAHAAEDPHAQHRMPADFAADRIYGADAMAAARQQLHQEHGAHVLSKFMANQFEFVTQRGRDGYTWDAEAWIGGDIDRAVLKTEGEGSGGVHEAEVQALYSRAIGPYFDIQAGLRHDFEPSPSRTYAVLGVEGLAPYWFDVEAAAFLSDKGDILARLGASYDQLITQRLVLQPRAELNFAAQDMAARGTGAGLSDFELGVRLRYEIRREFAPYVGVSYERKVGGTADFARVAGESVGGARFVIGVRTWF